MAATTLTALLLQQKEVTSKGITFIEGSREDHFLSYSDLYTQAAGALALLQKRGLQRGNEVVLQVSDNRSFVILFWACILGGMIPVPLSTGKTDDHKQKVFNVWKVLNRPFFIAGATQLHYLATFAGANGHDRLFREIQQSWLDEQHLLSGEAAGRIKPADPDDTAFIQFSSGSTGNPKGIVLTHANLLSNMQAISKAAMYSPTDTMLSWMPLTHDMGLIGFHLNPLMLGINHSLMPVNLFVRRPALWMIKASQQRATILCSPNFGYEYVLKFGDLSSGDHRPDLSAVRLIYNGAEPISEALCHKFQQAMRPYGLNANTVRPVYGLAEATLAVTMSALNEEVQVLRIERGELNVGEPVRPAVDAGNAIAVVDTGKVIDNCTIRIAIGDHTLPDDTIGHILIKGKNVTSGYYNNEADTKKTIDTKGWLNTGDLGFLHNGHLYITGRAKDIVFVNGQNFYPHDLENIAAELEGIELNKIVITGFFDDRAQQEETVAFLLHRGQLQLFLPMIGQLKQHLAEKTGLIIHTVLPVKEIPRTTSGKLQRYKLLDQYRQGNFNDIKEEIDKTIITSGQAKTNDKEEEGEGIEEKIVAIWQRTFNDPQIHLHSNFHAIGGNSLRAAEMALYLSREFGIRLPVEALYQQPTVHALAHVIKETQRHTSGISYQPVPVAAHQDSYPLSAAQKLLYYAWEMDKQSLAYNIPVAFSVAGKMDRQRLEKCIRQLVQRYEIFRTCFLLSDTTPVQQVQEKTSIDIGFETCAPGAVASLLKQQLRPFDLHQGPLLRIALFQVQEEEHILFLDFHHIIADGITVYNWVEELFSLYHEDVTHVPAIQYKDYVAWGQTESAKIKEEQENFWRHYLQGELPVLAMPYDHSRPAMFTPLGEKIPFTLPGSADQAIRQLAQSAGCTTHVVFFTIYTLLLSTYTAQEELMIGIPVSGRRHADLQRMPGMLVNNLPVRVSIPGDFSFNELLQQQQENIRSVLAHQDYPFSELPGILPGKHDPSRNFLFDTMFVYQNMGWPSAAAGLQLSGLPLDPGISKFDISLEVTDIDGRYTCVVEYNTTLFKRASIDRLILHFKTIVTAVLADPGIKLSTLSVLDAEEYEKYIYRYNDTAIDGIAEPVHRLITAQAVRTPAHIALQQGNQTVTYRQMEERAGLLATDLIKKGMHTGDIVALLLDRSPELVIAILAIWKAGGCYLPVDTGLPEERIHYLLADSRCKLVITTDGIEEIASDKSSPSFQQVTQPPTAAGTNDPAYVIYTSGTTGYPKGVVISHASLTNYITWAATEYIKEEGICMPLYSSVSFDLTITSLFVPLITGNTIYIYAGDSPGLINNIIQDDKCAVIKLTPSHLAQVNSQLAEGYTVHTLKRFIVGGEQLTTSLASDITRKLGTHIGIYNEYGPTEATVGCMIHLFSSTDEGDAVPIGQPIANTRIYILDKYLRPVPAGVHGELYIGGNGVATGYLFNEKNTADKFINDPFVPGQRIYKTGDKARRLSKGIVEYIGRIDQQVKISGYRIEPGEIEQQLVKHAQVEEAYVMLQKDKTGKGFLSAFYCSRTGLGEPALREWLAARLPHYMVPANITQLDKLPLTANGKVNERQLLLATATEPPTDLAPATEAEKILTNAWKELLAVDDVTSGAGFIAQGGDSIKAVQLVALLARQGWQVKVKDIMIYQSIRQISRHMTFTNQSLAYEQGLCTGSREPIPIEQWFLGHRFARMGFYTQSVLLKWQQQIDVKLLADCFTQLVTHHDGIRTNYNDADKNFFYNNRHLESPFSIAVVEIAENSAYADNIREACVQIKSSFDLQNDLLLKAAILKSDRTELLFITAHHLVTDGISWRILLDDLVGLYTHAQKKNNYELPAKTASMKLWEAALKKYAFEINDSEIAFWQQADDAPQYIPVDMPGTEWLSRNSSKVQALLSRDDTACLLTAAGEYQADVQTLLVAAVIAAVRSWTGSSELVIEMESHGRTLEETNVSRTLGWFTAMYPVLFRTRNSSLHEVVKEVRQSLKEIPHKGLGYGLYKATAEVQGQQVPMRELRFNYLGQFGRELKNELFEYSHLSTGPETADDNAMTAKLEINAMIMDDELQLELHYNQTAHYKATMVMLIKSIMNKLELILDHTRKETATPSAGFDTVELDENEWKALFG